MRGDGGISPRLKKQIPSIRTAVSKDPGKPVAVVKLVGKSSLIVFRPNKDDSGYETNVIHAAQFPYGSFRVVNLSENKVRVDMGDKIGLILPEKAAT